jgi:hypothetical protein
MSFAFLFAGILLLVSGARGTQDQLFSLVHDDFVGEGNFLYWSAAVVLLGAIGYWQPIRPVSRAFLVLLILVLVLTKGSPSAAGGGLFAQFSAQLNKSKTAPKSSSQTAASPGAAIPALPALPALGN